jgi:hypothetical protein
MALRPAARWRLEEAAVVEVRRADQRQDVAPPRPAGVPPCSRVRAGVIRTPLGIFCMENQERTIPSGVKNGLC